MLNLFQAAARKPRVDSGGKTPEDICIVPRSSPSGTICYLDLSGCYFSWNNSHLVSPCHVGAFSDAVLELILSTVRVFDIWQRTNSCFMQNMHIERLSNPDLRLPRVTRQRLLHLSQNPK